MFDPISVIIFVLKNYIQRIKSIFSFVIDNYFPVMKNDETEDAADFTFF